MQTAYVRHSLFRKEAQKPEKIERLYSVGQFVDAHAFSEVGTHVKPSLGIAEIYGKITEAHPKRMELQIRTPSKAERESGKNPHATHIGIDIPAKRNHIIVRRIPVAP